MKEKDIRQTINRGQTIHTLYVRAHLYLQTSQPSAAQAACVVSKKISPSAVRRHKYQRWLRETIKPLLNTSPTGTNVVLVAKPAILQATSLQQIQDSLLPLLQKNIPLSKQKTTYPPS